MATKQTVKSKPAALAPVLEKDLNEFGCEAMHKYGVEVNESRAIPALQDGMKPVVRRLVWSGKRVAQKQTKTARLVGDTMGVFHPHGDSSLAGAAATMVQAPTPLFTGVGNWGSLIDPPGAMRYTELKLNKYGQQFLSPDYLAVTPMTPNYDDKDIEPIYLPALLPNILLNDNVGIGLGVTTRIPAFTPTSLLPLMIRLLDKEALEPIDYAKALKFHEPWGGVVELSKVNRMAIMELMTGTGATIVFSSPLEVIRDAKRVIIKRFAPDLDLDKLIFTLRAIPSVKSVSDLKPLGYSIQCNPGINFNEFDKLVVRIKRLTETKIRFRTYVADRIPEGPPEEGKYSVKFHTYSIPQLIHAWLKFRVKLERDCILYRISQLDERIRKTELFLKIFESPDYIDYIIKVIRTKDDPATLIAKKLGITVDEAKEIMELRLRQLSKLDEAALHNQLKDLKRKRAVLEKQSKRPSGNVKAYLQACLDTFVLNQDRQKGCEQWELKLPATKTDSEAEETAAD